MGLHCQKIVACPLAFATLDANPMTPGEDDVRSIVSPALAPDNDPNGRSPPSQRYGFSENDTDNFVDAGDVAGSEVRAVVGVVVGAIPVTV